MQPTPLEYARCFGELDIVDAELIGEHGLAFLVGAGERRRLVLADARRPEGERWCSVELDGKSGCITAAWQAVASVLVAEAWRLRAFALDGRVVEDTSLSQEDEARRIGRGGIGRLRQVHGRSWACGARFSLGERLGPGDWRWWIDDHAPELLQDRLGPRFVDVDGFADGDVYALLDDAVWRRQGLHWECVREAQPRLPLTRLCCGEDGQVYLGSPLGQLLCGRDRTWKPVQGKDPMGRFEDLVWFEDRVWATTSAPIARLWTVQGGRLRQASLPDRLGSVGGDRLGGHLSVAAGRMLLAGPRGAALRERGEWHALLDACALRAQIREDGSLARAEAERKAARRATAAPVSTPRVAVPVPAAGAGFDEARLRAAIEAFNATVRRCVEGECDEPERLAFRLKQECLVLGNPAPAIDVDALEARLGQPLPPALRQLYLRFGSLGNGSECFEFGLASPGWKLQALDARSRHDRLDSLGLIDSVRHRWGNDREELEPGVQFSDAEIEALNAHYTVFGRYNRSEGIEAAGYLFFDRAGRFDRIWFAQDGYYGGPERDFFSHCRQLLVESTATLGLEDLLVQVLEEMRQWMREEGADDAADSA